MPATKVTVAAFTRMEARVNMLEGEISVVRSSLESFQAESKANHANIMAALEKLMGKSLIDEESGSVVNKTIPENHGVKGKEKANGETSNGSQADTLSEFRHSAKKVELPSFDGEDPAGWISRAEVYFRVQNTTPEVKVDLAQLCMEGPTIHFFNSLVGEEEGLTWEALKEALLERYGGHGDGDIYEQLTELKQTGTVEDYITEFEYLIAQIPRLPEKQFRGYFLHGLKSEIKGKVRSLATMGEMSRTKLLQVTRAVEKEVNGVGGSSFNHGPKNGPYRMGNKRGSDWVMVKNKEGGANSSVRNGLNVDRQAQNDRRRGGPRDKGFTHLSYNELMERKKKGLCFKCGGPFHPTHQCPDKHLRVLVVDDECEEDGEAKVLAVEIEEGEDEEQGEISMLDLHHIAHENHQTMKFQGTIKGVEVLILVDSGASHNFISQSLVHHMDWPVEQTQQMRVKLGNGVQIEAQGRCKELEMYIGDYKLSPNLQLFELGGIDVVLGVEWLKTLGDTIINWKQHTMSFWEQGRWVTLGSKEGCKKHWVALQSVLEKPKPKKEGEVWRIEGVEPKVVCEFIKSESPNPELKGVMGEYANAFQTTCESVLSEHQHQELEVVLGKYAHIFQIPSSLPPRREKEHAINLIDGHGTVNVRPYRYPHHHKNEIERQVKEMLEAGIIRHSTSAFSSPVILVKKKDNTWRMCVDYRALNKLVVNKKKCSFAQQSVEYLGHVVTGNGVAVDPSKVVGVLQWPQPRNVKGVRGFLGLTGYYRKFIQDYGKIAKPLTELTKKDGFKWGKEVQVAFDTLKQKLTTAPLLALPDFSKNFVIECDASGTGIGAILMQDKRPVAYFSKALGVRNLSKSAYEKELMAVVLAIQHWRPYLLGRKFIVSTDQKSLKQLMQQKIITAEQQNWAAKLMGYDFDIIYKQGKLNKGADALSRVYEGSELNNMKSSVTWAQEEQIKTEVSGDKKLQKIIAEVQQDPLSHLGYSYKQGILFYENRLVISSQSKLIPILLLEFHSTPQGGHSGFYKTYRRMAANLYWIGMKNTIQEFVRQCDICQRQKYMASSPGGLLQPLPIPEQIWEDISLDFITGLPKSKQFEAILVVVDRLSKYAHFIPLKHPYTARSIAEIFCKEIVRLHGIPLSIVSDRDPIFISNFWKEIFKLKGTKLKMSTAYHPESDGQTEVVNRCLETYLRCFIADQPRTWVTWLHWAEFWYNTNYHASTGKTPFEVVYGRLPPQLTRWVQGETRVASVQKELVDRDEALRQLKSQLLKAQDRMKNQTDKRRVDRSFMCGEWVFVKLRAHRQKSVINRINAKLAAKYYGPYPIIERIGAVAYKLKLPEGSRVHPVFHVSLLKKAVGNYHEDKELPDLLEEQIEIYEPEAVLAIRKVKQQGEEVKQLLIHWKGKTMEEATWEEELMIRSQFPQFDLEDKGKISWETYKSTGKHTFAREFVKGGPAGNEPRRKLFVRVISL
ncbi:hypothetical protein TSUD_373220 [Trifolium subterraneum]|uniref:Integrase catalytic domain-containing protein n=1 Tax=Trifolium subterraneum TaxID=3900 RepID=A0A2Z6P3V7_TRISU|nr:hypothetical protein TSUD_373220 [Trifolium subterraneum]